MIDKSDYVPVAVQIKRTLLDDVAGDERMEKALMQIIGHDAVRQAQEQTGQASD